MTAAVTELWHGRPPVLDDEQPPAAALAQCVEKFRRWLHLPDPGVLLVVLATVAANRAKGDPVWLLVVGPPGGGKTEILNPLTALSDVHAAATLTEASLLSGTPKREQASTASGGLLRTIGPFGIIMAKDFGSVLSMNRDSRAAVLAALREIYDGEWTRHLGTDGGRTLSWSGKVGMIAGVTPAIDGHHAVIGSMGERFVFYRLPPVDAEAQVRRALAHVGHEGEMRRELAGAVEAVLGYVDQPRLTRPADDVTTDRLVNLASLAVRCRSAVDRDNYSREIDLIPEAEAPARLALVLLRILNALEAIGADSATAWRLIAKVALDSMPAIRRGVLDALLDKPRSLSTTAIGERLGYPTTTARRALEDLAAHGIVTKENQGPGRADEWAVSDWTRTRWTTLPEMSDAIAGQPRTVPEMSDKVRSEHESAGPDRPYISPLSVFDDKSGTVLPASAVDPDADLAQL